MSQKIKILFPLDFSEHSDCAFPMAQYVAKTYDAEIIILHVLEAPTGPLRIISGFDEESARKKALQMIDEYIRVNGDPSILFNKVIKTGKPWKTIIEAAIELTVNAIVMGTHGATGINEVFVGTNAGRVIGHAPCPVFTVRVKEPVAKITKVLVPLDLSMETGEKMELSIEFAKNFSASLYVVGICESSDEETHKKMQKRVDLAVAHIKKNEVAVESNLMTVKGGVADQLINFAKGAGADLISIMTQQSQTNLRESWLGSEAAHVVNHSDIPVISIKPKREYRTTNFAPSHFG
jgi:nucleotide-binding universal stress UspA family protein